MASDLKSQPSITVYRGFQNSDTYVWSPFVTKLEVYLRLGGLSYNTEPGSVPKAPRGKVPYIEISETEPNGQLLGSPTILADSSLISQKLVNANLVAALNGDLLPVEKAQDLALRALLEDKLYFYQGYERWIQNYHTMRTKALWALPYPLQVLVGLLAHRKMTQTLYGQGTLRFSAEEIAAFRQEIWEIVNELLLASKNNQQESSRSSNAPFWILGRAEPSEADTTIFGFVASALVCAAAPDTQEVVRSFPVVVEYAKRIHDGYFPDYTLWEE